MADDSKKKEPYGSVTYADPGYQDDGVKRYPLDTEAHIRAAWSYINQADNASKYSGDQVGEIKAKIKAAARKHGIMIADDKERSDRSAATDADVEEAEQALAASVVETRSAGVAIDDVDFKERTITVVAVPYEKPALVQYRHAMWQEVFSRSAFNGINPRQRTIPVSAQLNQVTESHSHAGSRLIGRVVNTYPDSEPGLITDIKVSVSRDGDDTLQLANDGVLHPSVGFAMANPHQDQELDRRSMTRRINRAFLHHLSFVGEPAYPDAKVLAVRAGEVPHTEADLPPFTETPRMNAFLDDPIVRWALDRA